MTKEQMKQMFVNNNTKTRKDGSIRILECFKCRFGNMSIDEAFELHYAEVMGRVALLDKVKEFEKFLWNEYREGRCQREQSSKSESRYYRWNGIKYRFSSHVYPTGSMTDELLGIIDLAANPELINNVKY